MGNPGYHDDITRAAIAAGNGDRRAAATLIELTHADVHRFLLHLCDAQDVDDLAQETYLRAMTALSRFAARSSARTWLLSIARRVAADHVRGIVRRPRTLPYAGPDLETSASRFGGSRFEDGVLLRQLLDTLPAERRDAFVATQVLGLSYQEAAQVCDCPVGTIRSRVARARDELVAALADQDPDLPRLNASH
jgi:RNA polymerase sigma-70 factor (ECF subfamily)